MSSDSRSPYVLSVRDLVGRPGRMSEATLRVRVPERLGEGLVSVPAEKGVEIAVRCESVHEGVLVSGEAEAEAEGVCGRCLRGLTLPVRVDFQELFAYSSGEAYDHEVHDDHVDLEPLVRDAVVLALPFQPVCEPDCPGLDPETGQRLESGASAEPARGIDPRWAALADFEASESTGVEQDDTTRTDRRER